MNGFFLKVAVLVFAALSLMACSAELLKKTDGIWKYDLDLQRLVLQATLTPSP